MIDVALADEIRDLHNEVDCRIEHGVMDSLDGRAVSQEAERGHARLHASGESSGQAPGMTARTQEPTFEGDA